MTNTDKALINFSEEHELNHILRKLGKKQSQANRATLQEEGKKLKASSGKRILTHAEFEAHLIAEKTVLE
ncbi:MULTISPECIES: hypothetical protein [Tenebrionibacter/Tenebrionicola group]|uniref:Uncharacterized protein n=2 Tax=Tenebrionibacter/Tenebrionicola group TaxID=2969848 RepID=A0A8K0V2W8_9ENTR|nr:MULTISPECIES: hypothetical protein [Tenebrionibacter/Tenebrionicola group]MBK4715826.1 hypothetical protein [Tenebrionibacter intestinalis]MBV4411448.1 hypothetical protein [Tenebrionicola larvae]MBV5096618.1 hypothetical protein [Tenebrionicola larvae]